VFKNVNFVRNSAGLGGGVAVSSEVSALFSSCIFMSNSATYGGKNTMDHRQFSVLNIVNKNDLFLLVFSPLGQEY
jgi:acetylornithine/succinyldiaminopimelate/putrescine aminotransferase